MEEKSHASDVPPEVWDLNARSEPPLPELLDRAENLFRQQQWADALPAHESLLIKNPYSGRLWYQFAVINDHLGNRDQATQAYRRAVDLGFNISDTAYALGRNLALMGHVAEAVTWLSRAIEGKLRNLTRLERDPELEQIRSDPRILALLPPKLPDEISRVDGWRADLHYMAQRMESAHYHLFRVLPPADWKMALERLHNGIPKLEDHEIIVELMRITTLVGDGHTSVGLAGESSSSVSTRPIRFRFDRIPVMFYLFKDDLQIIAAAPKYRATVGCRVLRVGQASTNDALKAVGQVISHDNEMTVRWLAPFALTYPALLHALRISTQSHEVELILETAGETSTGAVKFEAEPTTDPFHFRSPKPGWVTAMDDVNAPIPLYLRDPENFYWFVYLQAPKVLYFQFNQVRSKEDEPLEGFLIRLFDFINASDTIALVIDLRLNNGGNLYLNRLLLHQLIKCDKVNQRGKLFTVIGRRTFSAAMHLSAQLQLHTRTLFVGEPTGASPNFVGEDNEFILPYSRLPVSVSNLYHQGSLGFDDRVWIAPDIAADPTFDDFKARRDPAMDAVFRYLSGS